MKVTRLVLLACAILTVVLAGVAMSRAQSGSKADVVAAVTKMENDAVKADLANDKSFYEKNLAEDWTGGDSSGAWFTKSEMLKMMDDTAKNKMNTEKISDLKVRVYGDTAIATYKDSYDAMVNGEHRTRTVISTDTFAKIGGQWKQVAGHASTAK